MKNAVNLMLQLYKILFVKILFTFYICSTEKLTFKISTMFSKIPNYYLVFFYMFLSDSRFISQ